MSPLRISLIPPSAMPFNSALSGKATIASSSSYNPLASIEERGRWNVHKSPFEKGTLHRHLPIHGGVKSLTVCVQTVTSNNHDRHLRSPVKLPWMFPGAPLISNGASGNNQGNVTAMLAEVTCWTVGKNRACFLFLTRSKLRLCSGNHRTGYFSNLACDWLSIVWAYSEQETENGSRFA